MNNKYFLLRHGEALSNKKRMISCWPEKSRFPLTRKGIKQIKVVSEKLKKEKIDLIFASDILRTRQTAEIVGKKLGIKLKIDKRLREYNVGIFNGDLIKYLEEFFTNEYERFEIRPPGGETYTEIKKRMYNFLKDIDKKYSGKTILIISHEGPFTMLIGAVMGFSNQKILEYRKRSKIKVGELRKLTFK